MPKRMRRGKYRLDLVIKNTNQIIDGLEVPVYNLSALSKRERFYNLFRPIIGKKKYKPHKSFEEVAKYVPALPVNVYE